MKPKNGKEKAHQVSLLVGKGGAADKATAAEYGVSVFTARRWRQTGYKPILGFDNKPMPRRVGKDGKSYATHQRHRAYSDSAHTPAFRPISCARSFLRQAEKHGGQYGIDARDVALLREVADMAAEMAARWGSAMPPEQGATHGR